MHANQHVFVLFLHANHCIFLLYACLIQLSVHILACMKCILGIQMHWNQIQVIRGGEERQEDLMGGEWRRGEEEGCRKETLLWGAKAQETHCSRRHEGVQVKISGPQMVTSLMKDDHSSSCCTSRSALDPKGRNQWIQICSREQKGILTEVIANNSLLISWEELLSFLLASSKQRSAQMKDTSYWRTL